MNDSGYVSPIIDLTAEPKDHLTALPSELLHQVIDYLLASHEPDKVLDSSINGERSTSDKTQPKHHDLDHLAAACKSLRREVMNWSRVFLIKHSDITRYKALKTARAQAKRNFLRGRNGLLSWSKNHCIFCGRVSSRSAILMNGLRCCGPCDRIQWPDKITKSDAKRIYDLRDDHLLPFRYLPPAFARLLAKHPGGLPKLRYGMYMSMNVPTTMFLKHEVVALAKFAHGDLKEHLAKKQAEREESRRRAKERKMQKDAEAATKLEQDRGVLAGLSVQQMKREQPSDTEPVSQVPDEMMTVDRQFDIMINDLEPLPLEDIYDLGGSRGESSSF